MISRDALLLARSSYYAPGPVLMMDAQGSIVDFNIALQVLMHPDIEGARYKSASDLTSKIRHRTEGDIFPCINWSRDEEMTELIEQRQRIVNDAYIDVTNCRYRSTRFGWTEVCRTALGYVGLGSGAMLGTIIYMEIESAERERELRDMLSKERRRQLTWDFYAVSYDRVLPLLPFYKEVVKRHVKAMSAPNINNVLDLGAGTGNVTIELLRANRNVVAVDLSRAMLEKLRTKVGNEHNRQLTVVEQNAEFLPQWADATFDGVSVLLVYYDMADPTSAFLEAMRTLRPGGSIVITEPKHSFQLKPLLDFVDGFLKKEDLYDNFKADWERVTFANKERDPTKRAAKLRAEDIADHFRVNGYEDVRMEDSHLGNCATVWARKPTHV